MGKTLFDLTVDDRMYSEALKFFGSMDEPLFEAVERDTTIYSVLMPEINSCERNDLRILRIEPMYFAVAYIDFLLMRSAVLHERFGTALCFETVQWYLGKFRKIIEPTGRSEEFLAACESRLRAYNEAWDHLFAELDPSNKLLT
ncbi:MAG: hypothetical protein ACYDHE_18775 [Candidatus Acidiferrales bacterium]